MSRVPSFGLFEVFILAGCAGLMLLTGAVIVAAIVKRKRQSGAQLGGFSADGNGGREGTEAPKRGSRSPGRWKWIAVLVLVVLALPLLAVVLGVALIVPVKQVTEPGASLPHAVVISAGETPTGTLGSTPTPGAIAATPPQSVPTSVDSTSPDLLDPDSPLTWAVVLPSLAGLVLLVGAAGVALIVPDWRKGGSRSEAVTMNKEAGGKWTRTRYVLLVLLFWFALSSYLILDVLFAVSLYVRFVAIYAAFWVLVGALLLWERSRREKLIILALFVIVLFSVRYVDWTSRKPFLRDLYRIEEGMAPAQVDQLMGGYMRSNGGGSPRSQDQYVFDEQGQIVDGWVTFRHTNEGWGDSDWGVVTFEGGRVAETRFLPD